MNSYDQKHLELLHAIESGQWQSIPESDLPELKVLVVCRYIIIGTDAAGQPQVTLQPEGEQYLQRLSQIAALHPAFARAKPAASLGR